MNTIFRNLSLTMLGAGIAASLSTVDLLPANAAKNSYLDTSENKIVSVVENVKNDKMPLGSIPKGCRDKARCD